MILSERLEQKYGIRFDGFKSLGKKSGKEIGSECGKGWIGRVGKCRRANKAVDAETDRKAALKEFADDVKAKKLKKSGGKKPKAKPAPPQEKPVTPTATTAKKVRTATAKARAKKADNSNIPKFEEKPYKIPAAGQSSVNATGLMISGGDYKPGRVNPAGEFADLGAGSVPVVSHFQGRRYSEKDEGAIAYWNTTSWTRRESDMTGWEPYGADLEGSYYQTYIKKVGKGGKLEPVDAQDLQKLRRAEKRVALHLEAFGLEGGPSGDNDGLDRANEVGQIAELQAYRDRITNSRFGPSTTGSMQFDQLNSQITKLVEKHRKNTDELWSLEDADIGRKPKKLAPGVMEKQLKSEAESWAKEMGFTGGGVNGFTAEQTKAHDVAHPATHRLIGMKSDAINKAFGGMKNPDGSQSLVAEEAIVNIVEHLSRGDTLEASIQNGVRLARTMTRQHDSQGNANPTYSKKNADYVRSEDFVRGLIDITKNRIQLNDDYSNYMKVVRDSNIISNTVTASGSDFTNSATGG